MPITATDRPASVKQVALIERLAGEKVTANLNGDLDNTLENVLQQNTVTLREASALIDALFAAPRLAPALPEGETQAARPGFYVRDGKVYRVVLAKTTGNLYAKVLNDATRSFDYAPGVHRNLRDSERLSPTVAAEMGLARGWCVCCGRDLSDKRSTAAGYGATCAKNNGWAYPTAKEADVILAARAEAEQAAWEDEASAYADDYARTMERMDRDATAADWDARYLNA